MPHLRRLGLASRADLDGPESPEVTSIKREMSDQSWPAT